jgi:hypothetical protein
MPHPRLVFCQQLGGEHEYFHMTMWRYRQPRCLFVAAVVLSCAVSFAFVSALMAVPILAGMTITARHGVL